MRVLGGFFGLGIEHSEWYNNLDKAIILERQPQRTI
jgi:hypothetical protein